MRPNPESPTPPNGNVGTPANEITELIEVIPVRNRWARSSPRLAVKIAEPRPYLPPLARWTASSMSHTLRTVTVGPNVSSVTASLSSGTSTRTVGWRKRSPTAPAPPTTARPPRASASAAGERVRRGRARP